MTFADIARGSPGFNVTVMPRARIVHELAPRIHCDRSLRILCVIRLREGEFELQGHHHCRYPTGMYELSAPCNREMETRFAHSHGFYCWKQCREWEMAIREKSKRGLSQSLVLSCEHDVFDPFRSSDTTCGVHSLLVYGIPPGRYTLLENPPRLLLAF